ncbi:MAG: TonB-dependent receptor, partial [Marinicaulis sp.]|nr:TonB-dependent receptor [Marinicaulis sp.]
SAQQLEQAGIKDVGDLAKITPGLTLGQNNLGVTTLTLRGVGSNDVGIALRPSVTVYLDEAPMTFGIEANGVGLDVERVEVLKGPQGTLFGANSTGGAVNYIANKPTDSFEAGGSFTYGRFDQADFSGYISGPLSDTVGIRIAAEHRGMGDWQRSITRNDTRGNRSFNNGRVSLLFNPSEKFRAAVTVSGWIDKGDIQATQLSYLAPSSPPSTAASPFPPANARDADWTPGDEYERDNNYFQTTLRMDYDLTDAVTLTSLTTFLKVNVDSLIDPDGTAVLNVNNSQKGDSKTFSQELRAAAQLDRLNLLGGLYFANDVTHDRIGSIVTDSSAGLGLGFNQLDAKTNQDVNNYAVFGNAEFKLTDQLTVQGGARYTKSNNDGSSCLGLDPGDGSTSQGLANILNFGFRIPSMLPALPATGPGQCSAIDLVTLTQQSAFLPITVDEHNVSWRAGLQFQPSSETLLYANASKGFKQGTLPIFGSPFADATLPVTQESVLSYEAGFKQSLADRKLQLNGAVFLSNYKDKQVLGQTNVPLIGTLAALVNVPKSQIKGVELEAILNPTPAFTFRAAGTYIDAKINGDYIDPDALGAIRNFNGTVLPSSPKFQLSASARYEWPLHDNLNGFVGANVSHQSKSYGNLGELTILEIKPYTLADLQLGVEGNDGRWSAYLWGRNIFNEYYWTNVQKLLDTGNRWTGMPATYGVTISYNFN